MIILEYISNKQLDKIMKDLTPVMEEMTKLSEKIVDKMDDRASKDEKIEKLSYENGFLRAKLGMPFDRADDDEFNDAPDPGDDIKFGD